MSDLFAFSSGSNLKKKEKQDSYNAQDIEVLEGLEPVRRRPGMYVGGTDESALHHLVSEVLDNSMDEAVAGYASDIWLELYADGSMSVRDNGRGIPTDNHPKFPKKSALEVILTTLHSGGKFSSNAYQTAGGLHGVGVSVVNALSSELHVEVWKAGNKYTQSYARGAPQTKLAKEACAKKLKGTMIRFTPDNEIFGDDLKFDPKKIYELAKSKAYLYKGVKIHWNCPVGLIKDKKTPSEDVIHFPNGLKDYLESNLEKSGIIGNEIFSSTAELPDDNIKVEWAICWHQNEAFIKSYCNTIPTPLGGTHEQGNRAALFRGLKVFGEMIGNKKVAQVTADDVVESACIVLSVFISEPIFQGQTKDKLVSKGISKNVENIIKDHFDHWLSKNKAASDSLLQHVINNAEVRISRKSEKIVSRKTATQRLRLPGKLADCSKTSSEGTELFLVEGDSAGGSAKQARNRQTQAILPLRGKILNVASATNQKILANQEIQDLETALNCGSLKNYREEDLRYEKVIIMTDADVDGAHIAALLMTFFFLRMPKLLENGHLYLARPPLYRISQGSKTYYASDNISKDKLVKDLSTGRAKIEVGRFKGLGEMTPKQLKETTMAPESRVIERVNMGDLSDVIKRVDDLMGKNPEKRYNFIQEETLARKELVQSLII